MTYLARLLTILCLACLAAPALQAQNMFAPVVRVNGSVITQFELDQRARLLTLFRAPGDPREEALEALINERLQMAEAKRMGIRITDQQVLEGMDEFAGRTDLTGAEFVQVLAADGVDVSTFQDFVRAGTAWRQIVRDRFGPQALTITEDDVEERIRARPEPGLRVLLSEIILPANTPQNAARSQSLAPRISAINTLPGFAAAARQYSASPSRERGGRLEWLELSNLPGPIATAIRALQPGQVTDPISVPNALAFFQLRALEETQPQAQIQAIDYAAFYIPGGRSPEALATAARLNADVQTCDDLYGIAQGLPAERLQRDTLAPGAIPADVALELAKLDANEVSIALTRAEGQTLVYLMLCERFYKTEDEIEQADRPAVRNALVQQRIGRVAEAYLAELRANATITYP
ncbi:SurA N-terminal domain-containing protein [Maribius pontilimi]|uniref:Parvulin-like PPIase n=1 Tax=Palleronia pontilimi TaxID=1964209 RepID=A0A934IFB2_9RHOB|nr:peptidylprolyl isomerase [Palleronia pontilimi]MBJ3761711.1 SurA N-terminal domain-containing protein [Palleronia pontilimi]